MPALAVHEILLRGRRGRGRWMLAFLVVCVVLASATYESIQWGAALALCQAPTSSSTPGPPRNTQSDMLMAVVGATSALVWLSRLHDRKIEALNTSHKRHRSQLSSCVARLAAA